VIRFQLLVSQPDDNSFERIVLTSPETDGTFDPDSITRRQIDAAIPSRLDSPGRPVCDYLGEVEVWQAQSSS
jgi:hypothetical protein